MQSISYYIRHPNVAGNRLLVKYFTWLPDKMFLKLKFRFTMGYRLDLKNPQTFSEKLQWLKLYNRRAEYTIMVDKIKVKEYVASVLGDEYIIPTLGVWEDPDKIDFDKLPDRFVLKCNHNSGLGMYICTDKTKMDVEKVKADLRKGLKENYYKKNREWPYKDVPRRILAEQFIDPTPNTELLDYKFFCFNGEPKYCQVINRQNDELHIDFFDYNWNHQTFHEPREFPHAEIKPKKPCHYDQMWESARKLAKNKPFSRIDLYDTGNHVYFGEITFFPTSGLGGFDPKEWDFKFGKYLLLP